MLLKLAAPFQDHAVLQRDQGLPVWGWGAPGVRVRVDLAGNEAHGLVNESGQWFVRLPALPAGGPHTLRVSTSATGETITISDLLVGEVWLASGQSNMEWTLNHCLPLSAADIAAAECPQIRFFGVKQRAHLGPHATVLCFVAGEARGHPATGRIEGDVLVVSCSAVPASVEVRYAWADNSEGANQANSDGLPASLFRSDSW